MVGRLEYKTFHENNVNDKNSNEYLQNAVKQIDYGLDVGEMLITEG